MRIVYVTATLPFGPAEAFIIPEITQLQRAGHDVLLVPVHPEGPVVHDDARPLTAHTVRRPVVSARICLGAAREFLRAPARSLRVWARLLRSRSLRILLKNWAVYPKGLWLARLARTWNAHHLHAHWAGTSATLALIAGAVSGLPWSLTAHRWDIVENNLLACKVASASFTRFISRSGLHMAAALNIRALGTKALVLHMGIPLPEDSGLASARRQGAGFVVLCPASLTPVKGHRHLIAALALLRERGLDAAVWLAGDGALRESIARQAAELQVTDRVRFLGHLPHTALTGLYGEGKVDIVVLPSVDLGGGLHEGIPVSLIEAMSHGVPVVSTVSGGIGELLDGGAGLLVPQKDPQALADAMERLATDARLHGRLAEAGRRRVQQAFAIEEVVAELVVQFERSSGSGP